MILLICKKYNLIAPRCLDHNFALKSATKTADQSGRPNENHRIVKGKYIIKLSDICFLETHTVDI